MATPVQMPNVGISVESCILTEWHKKKGDTVNRCRHTERSKELLVSIPLTLLQRCKYAYRRS